MNVYFDKGNEDLLHQHSIALASDYILITYFTSLTVSNNFTMNLVNNDLNEQSILNGRTEPQLRKACWICPTFYHLIIPFPVNDRI